MDIMETFTVNVTGGHWGLPVGAIAICASVITLIVNIAFAVAVFRDATHLRDPQNLRAPRKPIFVGRIIWFWGHSSVACLWRGFTGSCTIHA